MDTASRKKVAKGTALYLDNCMTQITLHDKSVQEEINLMEESEELRSVRLSFKNESDGNDECNKHLELDLLNGFGNPKDHRIMFVNQAFPIPCDVLKSLKISVAGVVWKQNPFNEEFPARRIFLSLEHERVVVSYAYSSMFFLLET